MAIVSLQRPPPWHGSKQTKHHQMPLDVDVDPTVSIDDEAEESEASISISSEFKAKL